MSPSDQDDTTERPRRTLREEDPRALFLQIEKLAELVKLRTAVRN